jgi:hypothetical protein
MKDESESMFTYSGSWNFDTFHDNKPIIREWQRFRPWFVQGDVPFPSNVSFTYVLLNNLTKISKI